MRIFHLIPSLDHSGSAAQLGLLAKHASPTDSLRIGCLGPEGPWANRLRLAGRQVDCLNWTRVFDPTPLWRLRGWLNREPPDLIHVWGLTALRCLALVGRRWLPSTVVGQPLPHRLHSVIRLDRWLLRRAGRVVAPSQSEASLCRQLGVADRQIAVVPPGVAIPDPLASPLCKNLLAGARAPGQQVMCVGALEPRKGFREAIWSLDLLRYVFPTPRLALVGVGPHLPELQEFAACLEITACVDFLGRREDVPDLLAATDVFWAPNLLGSSRQAVLEAMAAGRPVVATDRPALRELIADGQTGYLVPPGDKVAMSKRTRSLFLDAALAQQIGMAARRHVSQHFAAPACVERWQEQYKAAA